MQQNRVSSLGSFLTDRFSSEWKLLSETESYVSNTPEFPLYEQQFKEWRARLQSRKTADTELVTIRSEIVALRKELRLKGYDLSLGSRRLVMQGFRNDDSLAEGFCRVVICFCDPAVYYQTGSANHVAIAEELLETLERRNVLHNPEVHYLWYLRTSKELVLSGSATETAEGFRRLEDRATANPMKLLSALGALS
jgi:hypothetical protein